MIITNTVITVPLRKFTFKDEIKEYLYKFVEDHPFRIFNKRVADAHGEDLFSMTFIEPNQAVLTQRYPLKQQYKASLEFRAEAFNILRENGIRVDESLPFEAEYKSDSTGT